MLTADKGGWPSTLLEPPLMKLESHSPSKALFAGVAVRAFSQFGAHRASKALIAGVAIRAFGEFGAHNLLTADKGGWPSTLLEPPLTKLESHSPSKAPFAGVAVRAFSQFGAHRAKL